MEIGTWRGESIMNVAEFAEHAVAVTLDPKEIKDKQAAESASFYIDKNSTNIKIIYADSRVFDFKTLNLKFDLIFIDGDHSYEMILNDTRKVYSLLKDESSVIVWHDYAIYNEKPREETLNAICDAIPKEEHKYLYHVANTMCAIYHKKKFKTRKFDKFPIIPNCYFEVDVKKHSLK